MNLAAEIVSALPNSGLHGRLFRFASGASKEAGLLNHGIHRYPAKFIPQIPRWAISYAGLQPGCHILDPFAGSGTTLVEGLTHGMHVSGADISPLARLITEAKCSIFTEPIESCLSQLAQLELEVRSASAVGVLDRNADSLHPTWRFWFPDRAMADLLIIRELVDRMLPSSENANQRSLRTFLLVVLSETAKRVSNLDERQIKVRLHVNKFPTGRPDVADVFFNWARKFLTRQYTFSFQASSAGGKVCGIYTDARELPIPDESIDSVICSPPYINAIDYTMAHKYSLFLLDLVKPRDFKQHCREYIGLTERAVTSPMLLEIQKTGHLWTDTFVAQLSAGSDVDRNRAFIVASYFNDMRTAFSETKRVLRPGALCIVALGHSNKIRGQIVPTANILGEIATSLGFELLEHFYHLLQNQRIKFKRNVTAGIIESESILILQKR